MGPSHSAWCIDFTLKNRQPSMWEGSGFVEAGRILKITGRDVRRQSPPGKKPADLPIKQPKTFNMVNLKTANQIGLTIPQ